MRRFVDETLLSVLESGESAGVAKFTGALSPCVQRRSTEHAGVADR
jgi:hypothetical protein